MSNTKNMFQLSKTPISNKPFKVLNLYACLGGNRLKWTDCEVTAVELDPDLAALYKKRFPADNVIVADAHKYLQDHFQDYNFIWSSPPCPTHSRIRHSSKNKSSFKPEFPNMILYEEIIFLSSYFKGKYVVENVITFYDPLIKAQKRGRHLFWCNFRLPAILSNRTYPALGKTLNEFKLLSEFHDIDISLYNGTQRKDQIIRNLVDYEAGLTIFNTARNIILKSNITMPTLF